MDNKHIIEELAKDRVIEDIIKGIIKDERPDQTDKDLAQDLYANLLEKEPFVIEDLYNSGDLRWFVTKMVLFNIKSNNSRYYYNYLIPQRRTEIINDNKDDYGEAED